MSFKQIIGQEVPLSILKNSLKTGRIAHAYLFLGQEGVGKRQAARNLAKVLNCEKNGLDACDRCLSCRKIDRFVHPDVRWLAPGGISQSIKINDVLNLQRAIYLKPFEGRRKVFILLEAERMNREAANAFLKTLEEPPGESVLILLSSSPEKLLPTITSRCQTIRFSLSPQKEIESSLGEQEKIIDLILARDRGVLSVVDGLVNIWNEHKKNLELKFSRDLELQAENLDKKEQKILEEEIKAKVGREYRRAIDKGLGTIAFFLRDCLVWKITGDEKLVINQRRLEAVKQEAQFPSRQALEERIVTLRKIQEAVTHNAHLKLAMTVMVFNWG